MEDSKIEIDDALEALMKDGDFMASPRIPVDIPERESPTVEEEDELSMLPFPISLVNPSRFQTMPRRQKRLWWNKRKARLAMAKHSRKINRKQG